MKKSIKTVLTTLIVIAVPVLVLSLSACGNNEDNTETKSLYAQGLEIIQLMSEMTQSEEYIDNVIGVSVIKSTIQDISTGDYTAPKAVYAISITDENLEVLAVLTGVDNLGNASEELKSFLMQKIFGALMTQINGMGGAEKLAAASVCTVSKTFVNKDANENIIYLYTYDNAVPVAVTFIVGEDHTVLASGVFVMYDEFTCGSADEIKTFFQDKIVEVTEVLPVK